jgi:hypothetical protein
MQLSAVDLKRWLGKKGWEAVMFLLPFSFPFLSLFVFFSWLSTPLLFSSLITANSRLNLAVEDKTLSPDLLIVLLVWRYIYIYTRGSFFPLSSWYLVSIIFLFLFYLGLVDYFVSTTLDYLFIHF